MKTLSINDYDPDVKCDMCGKKGSYINWFRQQWLCASCNSQLNLNIRSNNER